MSRPPHTDHNMFQTQAMLLRHEGFLLEEQAASIRARLVQEGEERARTAQRSHAIWAKHTDTSHCQVGRVCVCMCACVYACVYACVCVCVCMCACPG